MENHWILFPIMAIIAIGYGIYYTAILLWIVIKLIAIGIEKIYNKIFNRRVVNNDVDR